MKETPEQMFDQILQCSSLVFQEEIEELKEALFELQSFDKVFMACFIAKEMGIPLWEVVQEGKEPINFYYEEAFKRVRKLWQAAAH